MFRLEDKAKRLSPIRSIVPLVSGVLETLTVDAATDPLASDEDHPKKKKNFWLGQDKAKPPGSLRPGSPRVQAGRDVVKGGSGAPSGGGRTWVRALVRVPGESFS